MNTHSEHYVLLHSLQEKVTKVGKNLLHHEYEAMVDEIATLMTTAHKLRELAWKEVRRSGERA